MIGTGKVSLKMPLIIAAASVLAMVASSIASPYIREQELAKLTPKLAVDRIVKGVMTYDRQFGSVPTSVAEINSRIWRLPHPPDFGSDGNIFVYANYYYVYRQVDAKTCTIWAIPTGPRREDAPTHFLLVSQGKIRNWKGLALTIAEIKSLPLDPTTSDLSALGLTEQITQAENKSGLGLFR